jgi:phospholipase C
MVRRFTLSWLLLGIASGCSGYSPPSGAGPDACDSCRARCDGACCDGACTDAPLRSLGDVRHLVIIYLENRSFDHLYGSYPGAEGLSSPSARIAQIDNATGMPYPSLPQSDIHFPDLPNQPFDISQFLPAHQTTEDPVHQFFREQSQINGGKMDKFVTESNALGLTVGHYPTETLPLFQLMKSVPKQVTLCDHFFHAAFGGSFLNHFWLISARTPVFPNAPPSIRVEVDVDGNVVVERSVTPDGDVVNVTYSRNAPRAPSVPEDELLPDQTFPTIGDRLNDAGVDWAWYAGGWDDALAGNPSPYFAYHHQPFVYFANYADGSRLKSQHLKDENDFLAALAVGTLPPVSFVKPLGTRNEHPGAFDLVTGQNHVVELVRSVMKSPLWRDTAVIVTYDENGGFWDHVPPPIADRFGPGTRIPAIVFSPFAKSGVDATPYDTTAILKLIEKCWNLPALGARDAAQADMSEHVFSFASAEGTMKGDANAGDIEGGDADASIDATEAGARDAEEDAEPPLGDASAPPGPLASKCEAPPVPGGMKADTLSNRFSYIPPQCYTKTRAARRGANPCYACHQASSPPNFVDDAHLQSSLQLPIAASSNPWRNLFDPPYLRRPRVTDAEILAYVRKSNYFDDGGAIAVKARLAPLSAAWDGEGDRLWNGYVPDAWFRFDDSGFDITPDGRDTGWRAFAYYPLPGTFFPNNGSMDDVLIRLDPAFRENAEGKSERGVYEINLAIVEALISRRDVTIGAADEAALGVDLDLDGRYGRATRVVFDVRANGGTRMRYVGRAGIGEAERRFPIAPGLFPTGTEFLHSVRYLDVKKDRIVVMAPRMKELRYAKKVKWLGPEALRARSASEAIELKESATGARQVLWEHDRGVYNGQGWLLQGFIEAADGSLRPQSYEESVPCTGCHGGIGATTDSMFALARKVGFESPAHGWFHWTQHDLRGLPDPRRADGAYEYELYLRQNGAGDELRENTEILRKFFDERGRIRIDALARLRDNIAELLVPSVPRALDLDRAYHAIVLDQSFVRGRDAVLAPAQHVFAHAPIDKKTGVLIPVRGSPISSAWRQVHR